jgi:hypothetical protein
MIEGLDDLLEDDLVQYFKCFELLDGFRYWKQGNFLGFKVLGF